ncbi:MAG: hypothetical protein QM621_12820 [Aeromicrobium sp.]|uniref:hypothetical protein n=1 Tax=Aeromicrobium sp. TaxID=1871063 RepID=UPI0039E6FBEF
MSERRGAWLRERWPYAVGVFGVLLGLFLAFGMPRLADDGWSSDAKAVEKAASEFVVAYHTLDSADLDDHRERVGSLVTKQFDADVLETMAATADMEAVASQQAVLGDVEVRAVGTTQLDGDSADVVVVYSFAVRTGENDPLLWNDRGVVSLVKEDGAWKVSDFAVIPPVGAVLGDDADAEEGQAP